MTSSNLKTANKPLWPLTVLVIVFITVACDKNGNKATAISGPVISKHSIVEISSTTKDSTHKVSSRL